MTALDMAALTPRQREVFEQVAIGQDAGHPKRVLEALAKRGLVVSYVGMVGVGQFVVEVTRWEVPIDVHIQWCEWCATQPGDTEP